MAKEYNSAFGTKKNSEAPPQIRADTSDNGASDYISGNQYQSISQLLANSRQEIQNKENNKANSRI